MENCLFCQVIEKKVPASVVYEDEKCIAFMDIFPIRPGHTLVVPKSHGAHLRALSVDYRRHIFEIANEIMIAQSQCGIAFEAANLLVNDGKAANQHVPHVHIHLIPRVKGDTFPLLAAFFTRWLNALRPESKRPYFDNMAARIRAHLDEKLMASSQAQ